ncbi:MAG: NAD+ synthase, partial [Acidobacteria bacterium]|nr:NAD+ synthase [Acidobacteriota bacterium]
MRLALLQINPTVGALDANADAIIDAAMRVAPGTDLCITPELALCGYPPRDLVLQRAFVARVRQVLDRVAEATRQGPPLLVGLPLESPQCEGRPLV